MNKPLPVRLDDLIDHVNHQHPDGGPLVALSEAMTIAERLGEQADHLIGHFVDQARRSGASWTEIGKYLGVSKQAAQKRFVDKPLDVNNPDHEARLYRRFTPRARIVIDKAQLVARDIPNDEVGDVHLLLGLLEESGSLAGETLKTMGVNRKRLTTEAHGLLPEPAQPTTGVIPFDGMGRSVLKLTLREALGLGHNYIGTEHLLLGLIAAGGPAAELLERHEVEHEAAKQQIGQQLAELSKKFTGQPVPEPGP